MDTGKATCPFCSISGQRLLFNSETGIAFLDQFPISLGHTLVIPKKHVASLFELTPYEQADLWRGVAVVRDKLQSEFHPDAFNIGLNDGLAAGQTIMHAHIHVVPRYQGDVSDPRGGIRWIIPERAAYWKRES